MTYWIFKLSDRGAYPDEPGISYVFDNTHSVKVRSGDEFVYLEKSRTRYQLSGGGRVDRVSS